ncbi:alkaline phosphatase D family protein [Alteraurantiacibacter palmitatis]|uniref:Alkaline phosphatase D family protein n=1 Tax=Alteraurantiacibacter palmitatis TaxID=2054628 RepID=A0ABV7E566_9SPHN
MIRTAPPLLRVNRRTALSGLALGAAAGAFPLPAAARTTGPFQHGVASGDPDATSVVLWTRATTSGPVMLTCELAEDLAFSRIIASHRIATGPDQDHTAKWLATGLQPGASYYYRFHFDGHVSPIGRARTLPAGHVDRLGIALASCSNFAFGHFHAYTAMAHDPAVDFVLHTGDYIYEYGHDGWGDDVAQALGRRHDPAHEIVSLSDYRRRHAQYKTDPGAQAMHAAHTFMACWDDHESTNNPWVGGAQNHQNATEGDWEARRAASIRAYYEWMPVREPGWPGTPGPDGREFWRNYVLGDLASLFTLESRHTARAEQADYAPLADVAGDAEAIARFRREVLDAPGRRMISQRCEADLERALRASVSAGQPWRLIGNAIPIARTDVPDLVALGVLPDPFAPGAPYSEGALSNARILALKGRAGLPFYPDTWDGYGWARERLYDMARGAGAADLIFLTGDSHSFWANSLKDARGRPVGVELGTAGVTSPGDFVESGFGDELSRRLDAAFAEHIPEVDWTDNMHQGYVRLDMRHDGATASFIAVDTVREATFRPFILNRKDISRDGGAIRFA